MMAPVLDATALLHGDAEAEFFDPAGVRVVKEFSQAPRLSGLAGTSVALLSNRKRNADALLERIGEILRVEHGVSAVLVEAKDAMSLPAPESQLAGIASRVEAVVVAVGDCGSCSATSVMDAIAAERIGVPAVPIVTEQFRSGAEMVSSIQGAEGFPIAYVEHPIATLDKDGIQDRARAAVAEIVRILCIE